MNACVRVYVSVCACMCVCVCVRVCVRACVCVCESSRASRIFPRMYMRVRKLAGRGKEKFVRADLPEFSGSSLH